MRRAVTRGYVVGLIGATAILWIAFLVAIWGAISLVSGVAPVRSETVPPVVAPLLIILVAVLLVVLLWDIAIGLLRGRRTPPLAHLVLASFGAYLIWCLGGMLLNLSVAETWLSLYAVTLAVLCAVAPLAFWAVLTRRLYTDRPPPRWPWEKHPGPDDLQYPDFPVSPDGDPDRK